MDLIIETFDELDDEDFFGLTVRQDSHTATEGCLDIPLDEKGNNVSIKRQILGMLLNQEHAHTRRHNNNYMKKLLEGAISQSMQLAQKQVTYQELIFWSPIKWVVAFIGSLKGLRNMDYLQKAENTNMLIVYVTDEEVEPQVLKTMKDTIRNYFEQGGIMIIRYMETFNYQGRKSRD